MYMGRAPAGGMLDMINRLRLVGSWIWCPIPARGMLDLMNRLDKALKRRDRRWEAAVCVCPGGRDL